MSDSGFASYKTSRDWQPLSQMRLYSFVNYYLSPIQYGIQTQHATAELFVKYEDLEHPEHYAVREWAKYHKTTIVLNGGNMASIINTREILSIVGNRAIVPWAEFHEDEDSLGGILTCVVAVLEEKYWRYAEEYRKLNTNFPRFSELYQLFDYGALDSNFFGVTIDNTKHFFRKEEIQLIEILVNSRLAG